MGNSNIKQHIDTAHKTGACQLSKLGLKEFPEDLLKLTNNLRTLDLSENKIHSLPASIGTFSVLKNININNNKLGNLPGEFGNLKKLEGCLLDSNSIVMLPDSFINLLNLRNLNLAGNNIAIFPMQLCGMKNLDAVDLSKNKITLLPDNINSCQFIELNLNQNQISQLPDALAECPRLKVLRLEENCLEATAFTPKILRNSNIALLAVEGNVFDMKCFNDLDGYEQYMERYTATKKKFN